MTDCKFSFDVCPIVSQICIYVINCILIVCYVYIVIIVAMFILYRPLYYVGMEIFNEFQVQNVLGVDDSVVKSWLKVILVCTLTITYYYHWLIVVADGGQLSP